MESIFNSRKASEKESLPGDRQGAVGASAGRDSLQATGGVLLNRRAHTGIPETITANESSNQELAAPADSVSRTLLGTTQAGLPRRRIQWTADMNEAVVRIYLRITRCGTNCLGYRQELYRNFLNQYPQLSHLTEQNVADRRALIYRSGKYVSHIRIQEIKAEVQAEMQRHESPESDSVTSELQTQDLDPNTMARSSRRSLTEPENPIDNDGRLIEQLKQQYEQEKAKYWGFAPHFRPKIPRQHNSIKLATLTKLTNEYILVNEVRQITTYEQLDSVIYCIALTIVKLSGGKIIETQPTYHREYIPPWKRRLEERIKNIRSNIALLEAFQRGSQKARIRRKVSKISKKYCKHAQYNNENRSIADVIDTLKQQLSVYSQRLRRYTRSFRRKKDNQDFSKNQKMFYENLRREVHTGKLPEKSAVENHWAEIWSTESHFQTNAFWLSEVSNNANKIKDMEVSDISMDVLKAVINKLQNWKCPGPDGLHNFWIKRLTCLHEKILMLINHYLNHPEELPTVLCEGITFMKPKTTDATNPGQFRPITCLNALYKIITSCLKLVIEQHCERNNILSKTQKGCCKGSLGCKELLVIDSIIMSQASDKKRDLHTCFIDYKKAFDMVPHDWLLHVLKMYGINHVIVRFLMCAMNNWQTTIRMSSSNERLVTKTLRIRRGIFQGDSLSPYWFCLAMNPLSLLLENMGVGYELKGLGKYNVSHLAYIDDIKLYSGTLHGLKQLIHATERFSTDIGMQFGIEKCKIQSISKGKLITSIKHETMSRETITALEADELYKYLGIHQNKLVAHSEIKAQIQLEFIKRIKSIFKTFLNSRNLTTAINMYAIPIITFTLGIIKWSKTDIESLERLIRVQMTRFQIHHPKSSIQRVTLPRKMGGRGILKIGNIHIKQIMSMREYFRAKAVSSHLHRVSQEADNNYTPLCLSQHVIELQQPSFDREMEQWKQKAIHGRYPAEVANSNVDADMSYKWLSIGYLYPETEGFLVAIQDQVIATKNYLKYIIKDPDVPSDDCRACGQCSETIQHIISGCSVLAPTEYKNRHDMVGRIIHAQLVKICGLAPCHDTPYYKYIPKNVLENNSYKLYWDRSVLTDRTVHHNRPDITLWDKNRKKVWFVDMAVVDTSNLTTVYQAKIQKYQELVHIVKEQWNILEAKTVPVVLSATGIIPKTLKYSLETLGIKKSAAISLQKSVLLSTCSLVRKFLGSNGSF